MSTPSKRDRENDDDRNREVKRPRTRSQTEPERAALEAARVAALQQQAAELERRRREALANIPLAAPGNRGDGKLHIAFIQVGQGDCIVVSTPGGRVLLIDCGSIGTDSDLLFGNRVRSALRGPKFLHGTNTIDVLILTHPDQDHYNQLQAMLGTDFTVQSCYHVFASARYSVYQTSDWLSRRMVSALAVKQVVHNDDTAHGSPGHVSLNGAAVLPADADHKVDRLDGQGGIRIVDEPNCQVSILAADVQHRYREDKSVDTNRGSIVTLIEAFGKKVLLCGDATVNTEQYLINTARNRLQNLTVVQIAHHGSKNTSSDPAFVTLVNPWAAVASAAKKVDTFHLPSDVVLIRYQNQLRTSGQTEINEHETSYWIGDEDGPGYEWSSNWCKYQVFTTGSRGTVEFTFEAAT